MGMANNFNVYRDGDDWVGKRQDGQRATVRADTQQGAYDALRDKLAAGSGGEITVHGVDGRIRYKNTIAPAHDPRETRG